MFNEDSINQGKNSNANKVESGMLDQYLIFNPGFRTKEESWKIISRQIKAQKIETSALYPYFLSSLIAASIIVAFFVISNHIYINKTRFIANVGNINEYKLPDKSIAILNAKSSIQYKESIAGKRYINLDGEAVFHIQKGKALEILTANGVVKVLGTSFNVFSRDSIFKVECISGKVLVENTSKTEHVILTSGQSVKKSQNDKLHKHILINKHLIGSWQNGYYTYFNEDVNMIFQEIERIFDININFYSNTKRFYTGSFKTSNIDDVLQNICLPLDIEYTINNKSVIVK